MGYGFIHSVFDATHTMLQNCITLQNIVHIYSTFFYSNKHIWYRVVICYDHGIHFKYRLLSNFNQDPSKINCTINFTAITKLHTGQSC